MKNGFAGVRVILLFALGLTAASAVSQERNGAYWGLDLGVFFPQSIASDTNTDDVASTSCDGFLFDNSAPACARRGVDFMNRFDMETGVLGGATVGYMMDHFRFELEYLYRTGGGDTSSLGIINNRGAGEFVVADESLDDFESHHLFANMYYDFLNSSRFTPYFGIGIGWTKTQVDYQGLFIRNSAEVFRSTPGLRDVEAAAGTVSRSEEELDDDGFGYQLLVGADYWIAEHLSLGMKIRYAEFDGISDGRHEWDLLRSHESALEPGGDRVTLDVDTDDIRFWGASLNLKYQF